MPTSLEDLPPELLAQIVSYAANARTLSCVALTCSKLHKFLQSNEGYRAFVQRRFPSIQTPPCWKDAAHGLTTLSRAWLRKSIVARCIQPPQDPRRPRIQDPRRPRGQTMGYQPVIDSYGIWTDSEWKSRKEVVAWGAGAELIIRVRWMGNAIEEEWHTARRNNGNTAGFDQHHHRSKWWTIRDPLVREGQDDITVVKLLKHGQKPLSHCEYIIVGRANGKLDMLSIDTRTPDEWRYETHFITEEQHIRSASVNSAEEPLLAACINDRTVAIYSVSVGHDFVPPLGKIQVMESNVSEPSWVWYTIFLRQDRLAVSIGPSTEPIQIFDVRPHAISSYPIRTFSIQERSKEGGIGLLRTSISSLVPLAGAPEGDLFLSGGYDGIIRLHDLRSPTAYVASWTDLVDQFSSIYSLLPVSDYFLAGGSNHALLKVFDMRKVNGTGHSYDRQDHALHHTQFDVVGDPLANESGHGSGHWNVFVSDRGPDADRRPNAQRRSNTPVVQFELTSVYDRFPDPIYKTWAEVADSKRWHPSWVMLDSSKRFVPLPREQIHFTSPPRTTLSLQTPNSYPGKEPLSITSNSGTAYVTNQRVGKPQHRSRIMVLTRRYKQIVYLPSAPTAQLQSFSAPILNLQDTRVDAPFFGANSWTGILKPVNGGNIPAHHAFVKLSMTFKDGGAFDFATIYERIKETAAQAVEVARENGRSQGPDLADVNFEQLPAYEEVGNGMSVPPPPPTLQQPTPISAVTAQAPPRESGIGVPSDDERNSRPPATAGQQQYPPPNEPPPGYEEVQQGSIADSLERRVRDAS
ncbi:MAG: hypothetical protein LQ341_000866 [Variospora aurantia]|nr:MAG: hypothetical protein LQ341_000866 [Variospora aurantia]